MYRENKIFYAGFRLSTSLALVLGLALIGCGRDSQYDDQRTYHADGWERGSDDALTPVADFEFIAFGNGLYGLVGAVKKPAMTICLSGATLDSKWKDWITDSVMKWVKPMRAWTQSTLTPAVNVVTSNTGCDATFRVVSGAWGYTTISNTPSITVGPNVPYGVVIHEFGHAFGLADTYMNGTSGNCQAGQPQSLMCNISFNDLQADDIAGMKQVFKSRFPSDVPPSPTPTPTQTPNPTPTPTPDVPDVELPENSKIDVDLAMAIKRARGKTFTLYFSAFAKERSKDGALSYCVGDQTSCDPKAANYAKAAFIGTRGPKAQIEMYKSKTNFTLSDSTTVFVLYQTVQGAKVTQFEISR